MIFTVRFGLAQFYAMPYDSRYDDYLFEILQQDTAVHLSLKPFVLSRKYFNVCPTCILRYRNKSMFSVKNKNVEINLNLLGIYRKGQAEGDSIDYFRNTRGFEFYGTLGKKIFYYSKFLETQAIFPPYVDKYIETRVIVPGEGWWKPYGQQGRDYSYGMGYLVYEPYKWLNFRLGHFKNFIGSGYRSLLLSDNAFNYPQLGFTLTKGKWQFSSVWAELYRFRTRYYFYHYRKHLTFNTLSYATRHFELTFFQSVTWKTSDYHTYVNHYPFLFFVPVIALPFYGLDNENNMILGLDANFHIKTFEIYGQLMLDKLALNQPLFSADNRYGYQIGIRTYDLFLGKLRYLQLRALSELNYVRPYSYQSVYWNQEYSHYNQPLAHPLGAGFLEKVFLLELRILNLSIQYKFTDALTSQGKGLNVGVDVLDNRAVDFQRIFVGYPYQKRIKNQSVMVNLFLHPASGLSLFFEQDRRILSGVENQQFAITYFGIRSFIGNRYYDF